MYSIDDIWNDIVPLCGNHEEEVVMEVKQTPTSTFYVCPKYKEENRTEDEDQCLNRMSMDDYQNMVEKIADEEAQQMLHFQTADLTGMRWMRNGILYEVVSHTITERRHGVKRLTLKGEKDENKETIKVRIINRRVYKKPPSRQ